MIAFTQEVTNVFAAIHRDDPSGIIEQFASLPAASQYRKLYALTARLILPGSAVLDWGCGRGHFSYFLVKQGFRVTAFSFEHPPEIFSALSVEENKRLTFVHGTPEDTRTLPFPAGYFQAAFSVGVLEHVREWGGNEVVSLRELRRILVNDGVFLCYHLPNRYSYIEATSRVLHGSGRVGVSNSCGYHLRRFTRSDIHALCAQAGLSAVELGRYGFLPRNSFNRLPTRLRASRWLAAAVDVSDAVLEWIFRPVVQNYYFVARPRQHPQRVGGQEVA